MIRRWMVVVVVVVAFLGVSALRPAPVDAAFVAYVPYVSSPYVVGHGENYPAQKSQVCILVANSLSGPWYHTGVCSGAYVAYYQQVWVYTYQTMSCRYFRTVMTLLPSGYQAHSAASGCIKRAIM